MQKTRSLKILCLILAAAFTFALAFTGCGSTVKDQPETSGTTAENTNAQTTAQTQEELPFVELTWYSWGGGFKISDTSPMDFVNNKLKEKINAKLNMVWIADANEYNEKIKVATASGEVIDLMYTSVGVNNFNEALARNTFMPIDELLEKYGQNVKSHVAKWWGESSFNAVKLKDKTFAIPNGVMNIPNGLCIDKEIADKLGINWNSIHGLADLAPVLEKIHSEIKDRETIALFGLGWEMAGLDIDGIAGGWVAYDAVQGKAAQILQIPQFVENMKIVSDWYKKGYISKNAATVKDWAPLVKAKKYAVFSSYGYVNDGAKSSSDFGFPVYETKGWQSMTGTGTIQSNLTAFGINSRNPERAMMLLDLAFKEADANYADPENIFNVISYGIKDKHYTMIDSENIDFIPNSGYENVPGQNLCGGSGPGNFYHKAFPKSVGAGFWATAKDAKPSPLLGFIFNAEPIKSELAQVSQLMDQATPILYSGSHSDPEKFINEMLDKMKKAGLDTVLAEADKQIAEWKAANGK